MQALQSLFSPSGRLAPRAFIGGTIAVYGAGAASQLLTLPEVIVHARLWPFGVVQALLVWIWYVLHAKRLRDGGSPAGLAAGAAILYALSIILLLVIAVAFFSPSAPTMNNASATSALGLILVIWIIATLAGSPSYDVGWFIVTGLMALAVVPLIVALAVSVWAGSRPSSAGQKI